MSSSEKKRKAAKEPSTSSTESSVDMKEASPKKSATDLLPVLPAKPRRLWGPIASFKPKPKKVRPAPVKFKVDPRTTAAVRHCETHGATQPFELCNSQVELPVETVLHLFDFLARPEIVHRASLVNKAWLSASRMPRLWTELNKSTGLDPFKKKGVKKVNMTDVLSLLELPQFSLLKSLTLPGKFQLGKKALPQVAKACPFLEEIDLGHEHTHLRATDAHILSLPALFPHLSKVGFNLSKISNEGIFKFVEAMGERLVELKIRRKRHVSNRNFLMDDTLRLLGTVCPNLTGFAYKAIGYGPYSAGFTSAGVQALLTGCTKLENLVLVRFFNVSGDAFAPLSNDDIGKNMVNLEYHEGRRMDSYKWVPNRRALEEKIEFCQWTYKGMYCKLHPWECGVHDVPKIICGCK